MGHWTTERPSGPNSSRDQFVLTSILALTAGVGLCMAFAMGFWVRGLIDGDVGRSARAGPELAAAGPPATADLDHPQVVKTERAEPEHLAETHLPTPIVAAPSTTPPAEAAPLAAASTKPPPDRPLGPVRDQTPAPAVRDYTPAPAEPQRFVLREAARRASLPFVLPEKPSFALADLKLDEPEASGQTEQVCAVDRSLNTALTWAKSPGAASEQARQEGKLVFLIHVSGNFEDPGFT
jgi:hypothetical protein